MSVTDMKFETNNDGHKIDRYSPPLNYELAGKDFVFDMDGGTVIHLRFSDQKTAVWREDETEEHSAAYLCLKAYGSLYFVCLEPDAQPPRVCVTFVLDLAGNLVTRITASEDSIWGRGIMTGIKFGTIRGDGCLTGAKHAFTDELVGSVLQWTSGPERTCVYDYVSTDICRVACGSDPYSPDITGERNYREIPAAYIRLKEGFYLQLLTERISERALALCFLQDYSRMTAVGYVLGPLPSDGTETGLSMFAAYGKFTNR